MSENVYGPQTGPAPDFLRNVYDKQFQNLLTADFGELVPCFFKEVLPGDSVNINPVVSIRSHPIVFPIQTRIKFYCHVFYGRNRILEDNFEDYIFMTKDNITRPWLKLNSSRAKQMISTGSLGDYLGVPSTIGSSSSVQRSWVYFDKLYSLPVTELYYNSDASKVRDYYLNLINFSRPLFLSNLVELESGYEVNSSSSQGLFFVSKPIVDIPSDTRITFDVPSSFDTSLSNLNNFAMGLVIDGSLLGYFKPSTLSIHDTNKYTFICPLDDEIKSFLSSGRSVQICIAFFNTLIIEEEYYSARAFAHLSDIYSWIPTESSRSVISSASQSVSFVTNYVNDATDDDFISVNPFIGDSPVVPLIASPFRLYEFICNYFYRNDVNNPYILGGEPQYNKFIPTTAGGEDTNVYSLHHRNWESDMYTTMSPSPQFGVAPLVGLTFYGDTAEVNVPTSDGGTAKVQCAVDSEGNLAGIINADTDVPSGSLTKLMNRISSAGISINDLRNVNSFQRFLENVLRRGLRYRNQLLSHFGVSVDYPDIDIPQFIGGFSGDLTIKEVTNMAESAEVALGDVAGKIDAVISSNHSINCYCPEHGYIMAIMSIVPVPTYSQTLNPAFTRYSAFDFFQKEFDKIGNVPVTYRNFLPIQANAQSHDVNEVVGYQKAWFDYMSSLDEVHGDFRTSLSDFVLYRTFKDLPSLNEDFLKVYSDSLNNIFAVDKVDDKYRNSKKFMCQFYFDYSQKTMIPKYGTPSLD